jgi:hypothetical protein
MDDEEAFSFPFPAVPAFLLSFDAMSKDYEMMEISFNEGFG